MVLHLGGLMKSLYKKICCFAMIFSMSLTFGACNHEDNTSFIDLTDEDEIYSFNYTETEDIADSLIMEKYELEVDIDDYMMDFAVSDSILYYAVELGYFQEIAISSTDVSNYLYEIQIRAYDNASGKDSLLYSFNYIGQMVVSNIFCNGKYLAWIEINYSYGSYSLKYIEINSDSEPVEVFTNTLNADIISASSLTITDDSLYWFSETGDDEVKDTLWRYDFEEDKIYESVNDITASNYVNGLNIVNGKFFATYEYEDDNSLLYIHDLSSKYNKCLKVPDMVSDPVTNEKYVVWGKVVSGSLVDYDLYIYDMYRKSLERIDIPYYTSYGFCGDYLVVNQGSQIVCYDIINKQCNTIFTINTPNYVSEIYYTRQGLQNNIYAEFYNEELEMTETSSSKLRVVNIIGIE